jgi:hypothetical protein
MERNYQQWHAKAEAAVEADARKAEDRAAADAEARRARCGGRGGAGVGRLAWGRRQKETVRLLGHAGNCST